MNNKGLVVSSLLSGALVVMAAFSGPAIGDHGQGAEQTHEATCGRAGPGGSRSHATLSRREPGGGRGISPAVRLRERAGRRRDGTALRQHGAGDRPRAGSAPARNRHLRAAAERRPPPDRRGLSGVRRGLACQQHRHAGARRAAHAPDREPESLRPAGLLHAARLGVEAESDRRVRELAFRRVLRTVRRAAE